MIIESLKNSKSFDMVSKLGYKRRKEHFLLVCCNTSKLSSLKEKSDYMIGFKVSRKCGNAVQRNYIKRIFRSIVRDFFKNNPIRKMVFIIIAYKTILNCNYSEINEQFLQAMS
jgi:ribonuclease P protein component